MVLKNTLEQLLLRTSLAELSASLPLINRYLYAVAVNIHNCSEWVHATSCMCCGQAKGHVRTVTKVLCVPEPRGKHMLGERMHE